MTETSKRGRRGRSGGKAGSGGTRGGSRGGRRSKSQIQKDQNIKNHLDNNDDDSATDDLPLSKIGTSNIENHDSTDTILINNKNINDNDVEGEIEDVELAPPPKKHQGRGRPPKRQQSATSRPSTTAKSSPTSSRIAKHTRSSSNASSKISHIESNVNTEKDENEYKNGEEDEIGIDKAELENVQEPQLKKSKLDENIMENNKPNYDIITVENTKDNAPQIEKEDESIMEIDDFVDDKHDIKSVKSVKSNSTIKSVHSAKSKKSILSVKSKSSKNGKKTNNEIVNINEPTNKVDSDIIEVNNKNQKENIEVISDDKSMTSLVSKDATIAAAVNAVGDEKIEMDLTENENEKPTENKPKEENKVASIEVNKENGEKEREEEKDEEELTKAAVREKRRAQVTFQPVHNDGGRDNVFCLTLLKNIVQRQLPKMPKEYITRLIFAKNHYAMVVRRSEDEIVGGIVYLPFPERNFAEIVFLAIDNSKQTQGYGSGLMSHFKDHVAKTFNITNLLTYADNFAIGYFKKQGFSSDLTLDKSIWIGYIKDYEGATLLQCSFYKKVCYAQIRTLVSRHREVLYEILKKRNTVSKIFPGLKHFETSATPISPGDIPGVREGGWSEEYARLQASLSEVKSPLHNMISSLLEGMKGRSDSHPFLQPVTGVQDYYDIIKIPMDLQTATDRLNEGKYDELQKFVSDVQLIWKNCRTYNSPETVYVKNANSLARWFKKNTLQKCKQYDLPAPDFND